jgi:hypothetical protein
MISTFIFSMGAFYRAYTKWIEKHKESRDFSIGKDGEIMYQGRPIITGESRISGGVLVVPKVSPDSIGMEATVIDFNKDGLLNDLYKRTREGLIDKDPMYKKKVLDFVYETVLNRIPYDSDRVEEAEKEFQGKKITLEAFVARAGGHGVCRHQALAVGAVLERLFDEGFLGGKVRVKTNFQTGVGGHAWVEYKNSAGEIIVIDPAQEAIGLKKDLEKKYKKKYKKKLWDYNVEEQERKSFATMIMEYERQG